jgi:OPA family glycerol-3-phosphate transporter-like MFS transporter
LSTGHVTAWNLSAEQRRIVIITWLTYALLYLGRLNLSPALPAIAAALDVSRAEVGVLGTAFFWMYALGQFVNGQIGNHVSPRRMVAIGLGTVAAVNLLFALQSSLVAMTLLWLVCGYAHSMAWAPMMRILSERLDPAQRKRISTVFPMSYQFGGALTWVVTGVLIVLGGWQAAFWVPGLFLLGLLAVWWSAGVDAPLAESQNGFHWFDVRAEFQRLLPVLLAAAFVGFVNVGAFIWLPTYVADTGLFPAALNGAMAAILPIVGVIGMYLGGVLLRRLHTVLVTVSIFMLGGFICMSLSALLLLPVQIVTLTLGMMLMGGVSGLLLSSVAIVLSGQGRTSSAAGMLTALNNVGGGSAGVLIGAIVERFSWSFVFALWGLCCLIAAGLVWLARRRETGES